jgi:elongation factor G
MQAPEREARDALLEVLADHDDTIMEKILEDIAPSTEEIYAQLRKVLAADATVAVMLGTAEQARPRQGRHDAERHAPRRHHRLPRQRDREAAAGARG